MGAKRKGKKKATTEVNVEAAEELQALEAIYGGDLVADDDRHGFSLRILPHPVELQESYVSTILVVRIPPGYPSAPAELRLRDHEGLSVAQQRLLSKQLHAAAAGAAGAGEVCCFDLVEECRSFLQEHNIKRAEDSPQDEAPSLWHEMQQRREEEEAPEGTGASHTESPTVGRPHHDLFDDGSFSTQLFASPAGAAAGSPQARLPAPRAVIPGGKAIANADGEATVALGDGETGRAAVFRRGSGSGGEVSGSIVRSVIGAVRSGFSAMGRALLPPSLQRVLDSSGVEGAVEGRQGSFMEAPDTEALRRDLLTGHLLALATEDGLPRHALPALAASLQARGLLPKWVQWALTQQPALFDRAFRRLFSEEVETGGGVAAAAADPLSAWALERFWRPAGAHTQRRSPQPLPPGLATPSAAAGTASRYQSDFQEVRLLGKGAFGAVLLAINRLDGRQYAVKCIREDATSATAFSRLMREVATLSRLQHAHVVRYFQAWFEQGTNLTPGLAMALANDDDNESDAFASRSTAAAITTPPMFGGMLASGGMGRLATPGSAGRSPGSSRSVSFAVARRAVGAELHPVAEESSIGTFTASPPRIQGGLAGATSGDADWDRSGGPDIPTSGGFPSEVSTAAGAETSVADTSGGEASISNGGDGGSEDSESDGPGLWQRQKPGDGRETSGRSAATTSSAFSSGDFSGGPGEEESENNHHGLADDAAQGVFAPAASAGASTWGPATEGTSPTASRTSLRAPQQLLFIQMEFCPRTLRGVLDEGGLVKEGGRIDEAAAWQVVRQTLLGLAHIHAQGIIHRDLNPSNIFYDSRGDIRLGDFGLAKFTAAGAEDDDAVPALQGGQGRRGGASQAAPSELSGVMGTSFYIAPEIEQGKAEYDERVDLFSLGVLAFELWRPFGTAMERILTLKELRLRGEPPPDFRGAHPQAAALVQWLLTAAPAGRPTARQVLSSELLPPTVEDQALSDMLRSLPDAPDTLDRVVSAVFAASAVAPEGAAAAPPAAGSPLLLQMNAREQVTEALRTAFARHGAVASASAAIGLATSQDEAAGGPLLLAPSGAVLALRYELRPPFVAWLARQAQLLAEDGEALESLRRYEIATVRRRGAGRGAPGAHLAADLDIVCPRFSSPTETALPEAESILAVVEAASALPDAGPCEVRLGHAALTAAALQFAALPGGRDAREAAQQLLASAATASLADSAARAKRWPAIRVGLEGLGLDGAQIGRCRALVLQLPGEAAAALHRLRSRLLPAGPPAAPKLAAALDHLQELASHLAHWGVPAGRVVIDPLLTPAADYHTAALWQLHLVTPATGTAALFAAGGRYDALLASLWPERAAAMAPPPGAVGTTVNAHRLAAAATTATPRGGRTAHPLQASQAQVLVCARGGGGLLRERMALASQLWAAGLKAEFLPQAAPSPTEQYEHARAASIPWMVTIEAARFSAADTVMVKSMERSRGEEEVVPTGEVARYLLDAIAASRPAGGGTARGGAHELHRTASAVTSAAVSAGEGDGGADDEGSGHAMSWRDKRRRRHRQDAD